MNSRDRGKAAEQHIENMLIKKGCTILARNYAWRGGEIDIIAQKNEIIAFIEVKMRTTIYFALSEIITPLKQRKIIATARKFISEGNNNNKLIYRFDVALLELSENGMYHTTYIPNAFTAPEYI